MAINLRAKIKYWLALNQMNYNKLAEKMTDILGKKYTANSLNAKLYKGTLTFREFETITEIFNHKIEINEE